MEVELKMHFSTLHRLQPLRQLQMQQLPRQGILRIHKLSLRVLMRTWDSLYFKLSFRLAWLSLLPWNVFVLPVIVFMQVICAGRRPSNHRWVPWMISRLGENAISALDINQLGQKPISAHGWWHMISKLVQYLGASQEKSDDDKVANIRGTF